MGEEAGIHTGLVALDLGTPHHVAIAHAVHARDGSNRLHAASAGLDGSISIFESLAPVFFHQSHARSDTQCGGIAHVGLVLQLSAFEQGECFLQVAVNLLVDIGNRSTRLARRCLEGRLGVDRHAGLALMSLIGTCEPLCQLEVAVGTHGVSLTDDVVDILCGSAHCLFGGNHIVGVSNPGVEGIPEVITAPRALMGTSLHVVGSIEPEPSRALCTHDEVVAHHLRSQAVGRNAEALVGVARSRPSRGVHRAV